MKRINFVCIALLGLFLSFDDAQASSLDDLYRDIIRADNSGYLPLFVKNREIPNFLLEIEGYELQKNSSEKDIPPINLSNDFRHRMEVKKLKEELWLKTIESVKKDQVTPLELNEISQRVANQDPQATEILAWMYIKGIGVTTDFIEAFHLYKKAAQLNVANAEKNAMIVYHAMNKEQRRIVNTGFSPL